MKFNLRKSIKNILYCLIVFLAVSCEGLLDTESNRIAFEDENKISNTNEMFYTIAGILSEVQKLGDKYVFFGELRGDLMTTSDDASLSLKEIDNFDVSPLNTFIDKHDFYAVINNCNYALQKTDTSKVEQNEKVMLPGYVEIKTIRAWAYFQLAQIFGEVAYLDAPVLDLESSLKQYPVLNIDQLVDVLIADLEPYQNVSLPGSVQSPNSFVPVKVMLGDLYLYQNNYVKAAQLYHDYITAHSVVITSDYVSKWNSTAFDEVTTNHRESYLNEIIASIQYNTAPDDLHSQLVSLTYNNRAALLPSTKYLEFMSLSTYFYSDKLGNTVSATSEGDLRGNITITKENTQYGDAYSYENILNTKKALIYKFFYKATESTSGYDPQNRLIEGKLVYRTQLPVYRVPQLYLRYAEAINRTGKPSLAFAALKYGLTNSNIHNSSIVKPSDIKNNETYINFQNSVFDQNIPIAARGRGLGVFSDTKTFVIPDYTRYIDSTDTGGNPITIPSNNAADIAGAHEDSIAWVELKILDEMAAETPFEGNRFFDLLRVSRRRNNHPEFMAEKVSEKYANAEAMKAKLMNMEAWYVK